MSSIVIAAPLCIDEVPPQGIRLGGAFYSAGAAAALGCSTRIIGSVGQDYAEWAVHQLDTAGIDISYIDITDKPTRRVRVENADELLEQRTIVVEEGECKPPMNLEESLAEAQYLLTYGHCLPLAQAVISSVTMACTTAVDIQDLDDIEAVRQIVSQVDWVLISEPSAIHLTGAISSDLIVAGLWGLGATNVVLKMGPGGALIVTDDNDVVQIPAFIGSYRDSVGAGDVFNATFLCGIARAYSIKRAGEMAALAASYSVSSPQCRFANDIDLQLQSSSRLSVYAPPEIREQVRIGVLMMIVPEMDLKIWDWLTKVLENHAFRPPIRIFDTAHTCESDEILLVIIDSSLSSNGSALNIVERNESVVIWNIDTGNPLRTFPDQTIQNPSDLLMCLYAFSAGGFSGLSDILKTLQKGRS